MMTENIGKKIKPVRIVITVLLAILLIFNVAVLLVQSSRGADFIRKMPVALLQVSGGSMEPVLHAGDAIIVRQESFSKVAEGDIIVFCRGDELIVHTVIAAGKGSVVTQGAANPMPDESVTENEYRAKLVCRIPLLGAVWKLYSSVPLLIAWILVLVLLIFGTDIFPALYERTRKAKS